MLQVRHGVFETNSSSTHSITMCSKSEYEAWKNGEVLFNDWDEEFVKERKIDEYVMAEAKECYEENVDMYQKTWDELTDEARNEYYVWYVHENDYDEPCKTYSDYMNNDYLDTFVQEYVTEHGDVVVAFGQYGYEY